jgi:predicted membrane chloride channel (bestrophin family)
MAQKLPKRQWLQLPQVWRGLLLERLLQVLVLALAYPGYWPGSGVRCH